MSDYQETTNASAWGLPNVLRFFDQARTTSADVYPSEMHFLENCLQEGISVLDVGCAQGGFATVLSEHLADFSYTGVDISETMIDVAAEKHPTHQFYCCPEGDLSVLSNRQFDLVLVLGILHLHEAWRQTLAAAWAHTKNAIIFDLRLTRGLPSKTNPFRIFEWISAAAAALTTMSDFPIFCSMKMMRWQKLKRCALRPLKLSGSAIYTPLPALP